MPTIHSVTLRPQVLNPGTYVSMVGGPDGLADDDDATYAQVDAIDPLTTGAGSALQFPGLALPPGSYAALSMRGRYQMVSSGLGASITMDSEFGQAVGTQTLAFTGDGILDVTGVETLFRTDTAAYLFPWDVITPTTWGWGFPAHIPTTPFMGYGCDFEVYEVALIVRWYTPPRIAPARRIYPRRLEIRSVYPPPNTQQYGRRTGSSSTL